MQNRSIRILIADLQNKNQVKLKRLVNFFGYSRTASASSFRELLTMTNYSCEPFENFDVLLLNEELAYAAGVDARQFCYGNSQIRHALIYGLKSKNTLLSSLCAPAPHQVFWAPSLTANALYQFMSLIDNSLAKPTFQRYGVNCRILTEES